MGRAVAVHDEKTLVDVLTLEEFRSNLEARLSEAQSVLTSFRDVLRDTQPALGGLRDAEYVGGRYRGLHDEHLDRVRGLVLAIEATRGAIATIIDNYRTTEERLTATASAIGDALNDASGALDGGRPHGQ
jgi:ABC-type transporter Mla subunit MlaD